MEGCRIVLPFWVPMTKGRGGSKALSGVGGLGGPRRLALEAPPAARCFIRDFWEFRSSACNPQKKKVDRMPA